jgi:hypothetical protein
VAQGVGPEFKPQYRKKKKKKKSVLKWENSEEEIIRFMSHIHELNEKILHKAQHWQS